MSDRRMNEGVSHVINPYANGYNVASSKRGQMPEWMSHILTGNINPFSDKFNNPVGLMAPVLASGMGLEPGWLPKIARKTPLASIWYDMMSEGMPTYAESYPEKAALRQDQIDTTLPLSPSAYVTGRPKVLSQMPPMTTGSNANVSLATPFVPSYEPLKPPQIRAPLSFEAGVNF